MPETVLLIDDVATHRIVTKVRLSAAHYNVLTAVSAVEGLERAKAERPALVLCDASLPDMEPGEFCRRLRATDGMADAGLIIMTSEGAAFQRAEALAAGADEILTRPTDELNLMALARSLIRRQRKASDLERKAARAGMVPEAPGAFSSGEVAETNLEAGHIAVVSPDRSRAVQIKAMLAGHIRDKMAVSAFDGILADFEGQAGPDLTVLDVGPLALREAVAAIAEYRNRTAASHSGLVVITAGDDGETAALARDLGAADALPFGVPAEELAARLRTQLARKRAHDARRTTIDESLRLAALDPLTGLLNRRAGLLALERMVAVAVTQGQSVAVLAIDVDGFKGVNDRFGHTGGDAVLAQLANRIAPTLRAHDLFARLGGDEFIIALPNAQPASARLVAERVRRLAETGVFRTPSHEPVPVTVSIGVATTEAERAEDVIALIDRADQAMYLAKSAGRNLVEDRSAA
jgi:two-component system, cell cycle response regulator